ncbi:MAG: lysophospholipid acyltransferase family protein [bacterium]|nr:lysophospholipid acyltransferase family protein [bacterium]
MKLSKKIKHNAVYWLIIGCKKLVQWVPLKVALAISSIFATIGYYMVAKNRKRILTNLTNIYSSRLSKKEIKSLALATYRHWAKSIIELLSIEHWTPEQFNQIIQIEGRENLDAVWNGQQGLVCVLAHYGNWELAGAYFAKVWQIPINVVGNVLYDKKVDRLLNELRVKVGLKILSRGNALKASLTALKQNEVLAIMADYDAGGKTMRFPFLESSIDFPVASLYFAYRSKVPVLPLFVVRQDNNTHRICFEKPLQKGQYLEPEADFKHFVSQFVSLIETYIRRAPTQWAWME